MNGACGSAPLHLSIVIWSPFFTKRILNFFIHHYGPLLFIIVAMLVRYINELYTMCCFSCLRRRNTFITHMDHTYHWQWYCIYYTGNSTSSHQLTNAGYAITVYINIRAHSLIPTCWIQLPQIHVIKLKPAMLARIDNKPRMIQLNLYAWNLINIHYTHKKQTFHINMLSPIVIATGPNCNDHRWVNPQTDRRPLVRT